MPNMANSKSKKEFEKTKTNKKQKGGDRMRKKAVSFLLLVTLVVAALPFQSVSAREGISVQIVNQHGEAYRGDSINVMVYIDNYGYESRTIYVGCSFRDENGKWHDLRDKPVYVESGKGKYITFRWDIRMDAPTGYYDVTVAAWKGHEWSFFGYRMKGELDRDYWYDYIKVK